MKNKRYLYIKENELEPIFLNQLNNNYKMNNKINKNEITFISLIIFIIKINLIFINFFIILKIEMSDNSRIISLIKSRKYLIFCLKGLFINDFKNEINLINKTKISIILPIFNCQKTIIPTIRSIQNQNMKEFEIILVNDFSTDNSLKIIQELANKDHRIKIIKNNKNMGTLYSRCIGTLNAKGKYTFPLDNDDLFMDYNLFEIIFKEAEKGNFDIVGFKAIRGFNYFIHISELIDDVFHDHKDNLILYQPELGIHSLTKNKRFCPNDIHIWGKSIKTEIYKIAINSLGKNKYSYFIVWAEDTSMVFILYNLAQSYKFISKYGVFHLMSEITSSFTQPNDNKMFGEIFLLEIIFNFSKNNLESKKIVIEKLLEIRNSDFFSLSNKNNSIYLKNILKKIIECKYIIKEDKSHIKKIFYNLTSTI